ncbi:hypothetical protein NFI96_006279 [Prochilodus magdalenae]|nr:hypothetical protein NFI96_006279 [Prochilodus magdalenae]
MVSTVVGRARRGSLDEEERGGVGADPHLGSVVQRQKEQADKHRGSTPVYSPGDRVWLSTRDLRLPGGCKKLSPKYIGPYRIVSKVNDVTYKLALPPQCRMCPTFHVSRFKPVVPGPLDEVLPEATPPSPVWCEGVATYAVRKLLDSRRRGGGLQYLVDWEGFGPEEHSWIPASDVLDPALIADFHRRHPSHPAPRPRGRPRLSSGRPSARGEQSRRGRPPANPSRIYRKACGAGTAPTGVQGESRSSLRHPPEVVQRRRPRGRPSARSDALGGGVLSRLWVCLPPLLRTPVPRGQGPMTSHPHSLVPIRRLIDYGQLSGEYIGHYGTSSRREALPISFASLRPTNLLSLFSQCPTVCSPWLTPLAPPFQLPWFP